ncbi:SDR family NAD(P)-dependent oxidoreductase [Brevibacillus sp. B_LB10_24]|uniref:SDR family NAD(P)-dependent oxidoreductase n=1 Tax=Brevibacillus sp. B_LB10_24 TaxID=3380645 RepID=UPI0038BA06DB
MNLFEGQVAIVTGGARGIGEATVRLLLEQGAKVAIFDLLVDRAKEKFADVSDRVMLLPVDIRNFAEVEKAVETVGSTWNRIDVLVNNAGVLEDNFIEQVTEEAWDKVIDVNLKGSFHCCKAVTPYMKKQHYGKIVMLSSLAALGATARVNYASAKAGIQGMTRALALELGHDGIYVNAVAPGFIETDMSQVSKAFASNRGIADFDSYKNAIIAKNPIQRVGQPEDVANVIEFLASRKSDYVTGQIIYVSGSPGL